MKTESSDRGGHHQDKKYSPEELSSPNTRVIYIVGGERLVVEPVPHLEEILRDAPSVEVTLEEFHRFRKELSKKAES